MSPSVYATQLAPSIASTLSFLNHELTPQPEFDPASSTESLQIGITDFTALRIFPLPFSIRTFEVKIYSHKRSGQRGATRWLKEELQALAQARHSGLSGSQERMSPG